MARQLTIVGGGIGGLVAAVSAKEAGFDVTLHEAKGELGGRARTSQGPYRANWGPHVLYANGPTWAWLDRRGLAGPARGLPVPPRIASRVEGELRHTPPPTFLRALLRLRRLDAPVDAPFEQWASEAVGSLGSARRVANFLGVATFDHDPGRFSAAFVNGILRRVTSLSSRVRYVQGGWGTLVTRLSAHARQLGVRIETGCPVDHLPPPPVILAVPLDRAAVLLGDPTLHWTGTRTALLDLGMKRRHRDPFIVSDLDASGWVEIYSKADTSMAPPGQQLIQCQTGIREGESLDQAVTRIEELIDLALPRWRERETWRRRMAVESETGALDLPGSTWRDRPACDRGHGVYIVGDMVAAPGLLSEVSVNAAVESVARLAAAHRSIRAA